MRIQRCLVSLAAAASLVIGVGQLAAQPLEFGIGPPEVELVLGPGATGSGVVVVFNKSLRRVRFRVTLEDIFIRPDGAMDVLKPGSLSWSAVAVSKLTPTEFDLDSDQQMPVRVSTTVPPQARGGLYGAIIVSPTPVLQPAPNSRGTYSVIVPKLSARLLVQVRGTEVVGGAIVNMLAAPRAGGKGADLKVVFRNTGNIHVRTSGEVTILNTAGEQVGKMQLPQALVLPATVREFKLFWEAKSLEPGSYTVRAVLDYGGDVLVAGEVGFTYRKQ